MTADHPAPEPRTEAEWTWLNDDYRAGTVFITDDPTGEQGAIAEGLRETVADRIVNAHNAVVRALAEAAQGAAPRAEGLDVERLTRAIEIEDDRLPFLDAGSDSTATPRAVAEQVAERYARLSTKEGRE